MQTTRGQHLSSVMLSAACICRNAMTAQCEGLLGKMLDKSGRASSLYMTAVTTSDIDS